MVQGHLSSLCDPGGKPRGGTSSTREREHWNWNSLPDSPASAKGLRQPGLSRWRFFGDGKGGGANPLPAHVPDAFGSGSGARRRGFSPNRAGIKSATNSGGGGLGRSGLFAELRLIFCSRASQDAHPLLV